MAKVRNNSHTLIWALVAAHNALARQGVGSNFHYDKLATVGGTDFHTPTFTAITIDKANGTTLPTTIALANQLKYVLNAHMADGLPTGSVHAVVDSVNPITAADASDQTTVNTLLNQIKTKFNAHLTQATVHPNNDGTNGVATANATDLASSEALANALKTAVNAHMASAVATPSIVPVG